MKGLTWSSLKKEPALIPLFGMIGAACIGAFAYTIRLATRSPDVAWVNRGHVSNQEYEAKQYKFLSPSLDYSKVRSQAPKYEE